MPLPEEGPTAILRLDDRWIWDSWAVDDGQRHHLFYLQAPTSLGDPGERNTNATVGHASSDDLVHWALDPDALAPTPGSWDDLAIWTGSVRGPNDWRMFQTAIGTRGNGAKDQRIGVARSDDLIAWRRIGGSPVVPVEPRWYKTLDGDPSANETWRDPFVMPDPSGAGWHMIITARAVGADRNADGVLAHASSTDLERWTLHGPLGAPAGFGQLEVPQVRCIDGTWVLVFTCQPDEQTAEQVARFGPHSTWSLTGDTALGPWDLDRARPFESDPQLFAAPLVQRRDGSWALIGFRNTESAGRHELWIVDPVTVRVAGDRLVTA